MHLIIWLGLSWMIISCQPVFAQELRKLIDIATSKELSSQERIEGIKQIAIHFEEATSATPAIRDIVLSESSDPDLWYWATDCLLKIGTADEKTIGTFKQILADRTDRRRNRGLLDLISRYARLVTEVRIELLKTATRKANATAWSDQFRGPALLALSKAKFDTKDADILASIALDRSDSPGNRGLALHHLATCADADVLTPTILIALKGDDESLYPLFGLTLMKMLGKKEAVDELNKMANIVRMVQPLSDLRGYRAAIQAIDEYPSISYERRK